MWDLGLVSSDSPKDVVSGKIKVFGNIWLFSRGKLGPKMDQNGKLWVRPFSP